MADKPDIRERFGWAGSKDRRGLASAKLEVFDGRHQQTLAALVRSRMSDVENAAEVVRWTNASRNLLRQIVRTVCIAYSRGVVRTLDATVGPAAAAAFASVIDESQLGAVAPLINQYGWLLGPSFVLPQVEADGTFWLDLISPGRAEVILQNPKTVSELLFQRADGLFVRVDGESFSYYDSGGAPMPKLAPVVHGLKYAPVAIFRSEPWTSSDWWNAHSHRPLLDASLDCAVFDALMCWTRKNSNKQLVIVAPEGALGGKQIIGHPERPLYFAGTPADVSVDAIDLDGSPATWLDLIAAKQAGVCELYGLPPYVLSGGTNGNVDAGQVGLARAPEVLDSLRDEQIPWMRLGEKQLFPAICDLLRASTHKHAKTLPPGDEVRDALCLRWIEPMVNVERKIKRLELFEKQEKLGLASVIDLEIEDRPELTAEQAAENINSRRALYLKRLDDLAKHNAPANGAAAVDSLAAAQGQTGGLTRAANEAAKAADEENT